MNVALRLTDFPIEYTSLLETKNNIITDGVFTKIIFSNNLFVMNGIFFYFPIDIHNIINSNGRLFVNFDPSSSYNSNIINSISIIENNILSFYKNSTVTQKNESFILQNQLFSGNIKVYKDSNNSNFHNNFKNKQFILKISGIWENRTEFGITYKIIVANKY